MAVYEVVKTGPANSQITPNTSVKSAIETLTNAVSELQKTCEELRDRVQPVLENSPVADSACPPVSGPARLSPNACQLACAIDCESERIEKLAGDLYRLMKMVQL